MLPSSPVLKHGATSTSVPGRKKTQACRKMRSSEEPVGIETSEPGLSPAKYCSRAKLRVPVCDDAAARHGEHAVFFGRAGEHRVLPEQDAARRFVRPETGVPRPGDEREERARV